MNDECWWCHWGWPKQITDIYREATEKLHGNTDPLNFGPAHIVWEDENWDSARWCLDRFDDYRGDHSDEELAIVRWSLEELLKVPEEFKDWPSDYEGNNPEKFPPPGNWVMVQRDG